MESSTERWLDARIAPPVAGTFSAPITSLRASRCRQGPRMNFDSWYFTQSSRCSVPVLTGCLLLAGHGQRIATLRRSGAGASAVALDPDDHGTAWRRPDRAYVDHPERDLALLRRSRNQAGGQATAP